MLVFHRGIAEMTGLHIRKTSCLTLCIRLAGAVLIAPVRTAKLPMRVLHIDPKASVTVGIGNGGRPKMTCMKYHAFLAFLSVYAKLSFLSRKFALCVIYLPIMCLWCSKTPPFAFAWRKGNVATRRWRGDKKIRAFSSFSERSISVAYHS